MESERGFQETHKGDAGIDEETRPERLAARELERLDADAVEKDADGPDEEDVEEADEAEEQRHRDARLVADADLEKEDVGGIGESGQ